MRADLLPKDLTGALRKVIQESGEVILAITKLEDFGGIAKDPITGRTHFNVRDVLREFSDLEHAIAVVRQFYAQHGITVPLHDVPITKLQDNPKDKFLLE